MSNSIKKNYVFNLIFQILNIVAPLVTMPYVSRVLGAYGVGEYSYTFSVVSYFLIFASLGTTLYGCREIANNCSNKHKKSIIFWEIMVIRIVASILVISGYLSFIYFYDFQLDEKVLLTVSVFYILGTTFDISWFFQGEQNFQIITLITIFVKLSTIVVTFTFIHNANDTLKYVLLHALMAFINSLLYFIYLRGRIEKVSIKELNVGKHLLPVLILLVPQVSKEVYGVLDKTMIGEFYSDRALNGYYEQATNIVSMSMTLITSLNIVMMSNLSQDYDEKKQDIIRDKVADSFQFVWFLGIPLCAGIISVIDIFVPLFFGKGYEPVVELVYILTPRLLIIGISNVIGIQYLITLKRHAAFNTSIILGLLGNALLNIILIPRFNVYGAAVATVISEGIVTFTQLMFVKKDIKFGLIFPNEIFKRFISTGIMLGSIWLIKRIVVGVPMLILLAICVAFGVMVYVVVELLFDDTMMRMVLDVVKNKIVRS